LGVLVPHHRSLALAAFGVALASWSRPAAAECTPSWGDTPPGERDPRAPLIIRKWHPGDALPCGYTPRSRPRVSLIVAGGIVMTLTHLATVVAGALTAQSDPRNLVVTVPIVGPIIEAARVDVGTFGPLVIVYTALDVAGQAAGLGMLVAGTTTRNYTLVRSDAASPRVLPVPMALGRAGGGLGLAGTF
jgi:hypothetical protein